MIPISSRIFNGLVGLFHLVYNIKRIFILQKPINSLFMTCLVGNCLSFLQFLAKINLLKPQKTYIYRFLPNLPAATIASSSISDQTPPQQYRHPSTTKIQPRHKKSFQSSFISPLQKPYAKISNFYNQILTLTIKKSSEIIIHLRASIHIQASHSFYYDYIMNN